MRGYSIIIFLFWLWKGLDLFIGLGFRTPTLKPVDKRCLAPVVPRVSVVFAFRDEPDLEPALRTMLAQDYPDFEVIAVNDRSEPGFTLPQDPRLKLVRVDALPDGWLGKTHALWRGYRESRGEWLLFTDADVRFEKGTLAAAVAEAEARKLDSLSLFPRLLNRGYLELIFTSAFALGFNMLYRPWAAQNPKSKSFVGIGAFNMVRRSAYERAGTHEALKFEVADDMVLGKLVKEAGARQMLFLGHEAVAVRWVDGWRGVISSLKKNAFAGVKYSVAMLVGATIAQVSIGVMPFVLVFSGDAPTRAAALGSLAMLALIYAGSAKADRKALIAFPAHPAATLLLLGVLWNSAISILKDGGVTWRGTFYPLAELKKHKKL